MPRILLANPRGFCAGVDRAIGIVERALENFGAPIYVRHEVVHNRRVVDGLREQGAVFVEELHEVPDGATVIFSAHGVSQAVREEAGRRGLRVFDATCPLVTKVHLEVEKHARRSREVVLIGHDGHPEVEGTIGQYVGQGAERGAIYLVETPEDVERLDVRNPEELAFVSQTTLSMDDTARIIEALKARFPAVQAPRKDDICYATQNRQDAVKDLAEQADMLIVIGARNSSNSTRLRELGERMGIPAYQIDSVEDLQQEWVQGHQLIGVTSGASVPDVLVQEVIERLNSWGIDSPRELKGREENVVFSLPRDLMRSGSTATANS
ncbi:4-hydroxy-3-methylbut-2-enyl diphosphate reductase [Aquisalimonas sp.]|uniref:4-hydroxy-3-methylbut-2-enyl diphosphate reductase n=1 Tax=Aquisalimonas sp. TaxID=1872621 RepID=UPI0025C0AAA9|nr:4-hydroxy-3-methylbut-2-enyl diphosphate reductase [Aquisalimonas sp.]